MNDIPSREDRLATKLRENLRRRKAQARKLSDNEPDTGSDTVPVSESADSEAPLPNRREDR